MKKIMMLLAAAVLLLGLNGQAMAYFSQGDLIQVVYQAGGANEVATDLGAISTLGGLTTAYTGATQTLDTITPTAGTGAFSTATTSNLNVAYFVWGGTQSAPVWVSGSQSQTENSRKGANVNSAMTSVLSNYTSLTSGAQATGLQSTPNSYYTKLDQAGNGAGLFANLVAGSGEANLAALSTTGYVDSYLNYYSTINAGSNGTAGLQVADIRTFSNGTTEIVGTATPIPPSVLLMGSGLLGLVGIRRKHVA